MGEVHKPKTVGRYRRGEKIGYGNFGVVYKGLDTQTNRVVAIKTLDLDAVNDEVESVQHEVELLSHLSMAESSNVTKYYGTVLEGSKLWIVMDLCSGGSVRTLLKAGPLDDKYLSVIFREITIAVVAIHREGIIHRDIKAANVLITMAGQVKLCDFGVAANTSLSSQAKRQTIVGTPYWMAPEVITEGCSYTNKADIWSMGITFYEIITGNPPYSEHEAMRALMLITNSRPPRLEGPKYTPSLKDLVALCLDEDPEARPSAETVLKHKFLKSYSKTPTSTLRSLVERYISWKHAHRDHRDSLLMFNPHQDNDDAASIAPSNNDEDNDSVWDFSIEEDDTEEEEDGIGHAFNEKPYDNDKRDGYSDGSKSDDVDNATLNAKLSMRTNGGSGKRSKPVARAPPEDLSDAPDSLRELFGVPPKREEEEEMFPGNLRRTMTDASLPSIPTTSTPPPSAHIYTNSQSDHPSLHFQHQPENTSTITENRQVESAPFIGSPDLGPNLRSPNPGPTAHAATTHGTPNPGSLGHVGSNIGSLNYGVSQSQPQTGQDFVFPPAKSHPSQEKPQLNRVPTAISASRSRSITAAASGGGWTGYRSRHGSDATPSDPEIPAQPTPPATSQPSATVVNQDQTASNPQAPSSPSKSSITTSSPTASPSPKRTVGRRQVAPEVKSRANLPRLQMPPRNSVKPLPLMSAPAGPVKHHLFGSSGSDTPITAGNISTSSSLTGSFSNGTSDSGSTSSSLKRMPGWPSEFPPMPKIDTNILLDSTPEDLVVDHLLELACGFRTAVASLANQLEDK